MPKRLGISQSFTLVRLNTSDYQSADLGSLGVIKNIWSTGGADIFQMDEDHNEYVVGQEPIEEWATIQWIDKGSTSGPFNLKHLDNLGEGFVRLDDFRDEIEAYTRRDTIQAMLGDINPILNKFKSSFNHEHFHDFLAKWTKELTKK